MRRTILTLAIAACALPAAVTAQAPPAMQAPPPPGVPPAAGLMRADANGDGVVTRAEALADADARFDRFDANRDGRIGRGDVQVASQQRAAPPPGGTYEDRVVPPPPPPPSPPRPAAGAPGMTREAFRQRAMARFERADANRDGRVDRAEIAAMRTQAGTPSAPR